MAGPAKSLSDVRPIAHVKGPEDFAEIFAVSRESLQRLKIYEELLVQWQKVQNLVSPTTLGDIWHRHFADSSQLLDLAGDARIITDLGCGAGFPGLVLAILLAERGGAEVHLIEANGRKCGFLREVARKTGLSASEGCGISVEIHHGRIEEIHDSQHGFKADLITARALAPLSSLLDLAQPFFGKNSRALFLKGRGLEGEIQEALRKQAFQYKIHASRTDREGQIAEISDVGSP